MNQAVRELLDAVDAYVAWTEGDSLETVGVVLLHVLLQIVKKKASKVRDLLEVAVEEVG